MIASAERRGEPQQRGSVHEWHVLQRPLPLTPASAGLARVAARVACRAWRVPEQGECAALAASELVTATLRHAAHGPLTLRVLMTPRRLRLEVHDPSGSLSDGLDPATSSDDAASVAVLTASTARWGVDRCRPGAQLWAEIAVERLRRAGGGA